MEITLTIAIIGAVIALIEQLLSYTPPGYPKSIFQCFVYLGVYIKRKIQNINNTGFDFLYHDIEF